MKKRKIKYINVIVLDDKKNVLFDRFIDGVRQEMILATLKNDDEA